MSPRRNRILDELVSEITPETRPIEVEVGPSVGEEFSWSRGELGDKKVGLKRKGKSKSKKKATRKRV